MVSSTPLRTESSEKLDDKGVFFVNIFFADNGYFFIPVGFPVRGFGGLKLEAIGGDDGLFVLDVDRVLLDFQVIVEAGVEGRLVGRS